MEPISGQIRLDATIEGAPSTCSLSAPITYHSEDGILALKGDLWLGDSRISSAHDAGKILDVYHQSGPAVLSKLKGTFALVLALPKHNKAMIAVDRMGIERLTWAQRDGRLVVGTSAEDVARRISENPQLEPQALFDFMLGHMIPAPQTVFRDVQKVGAGTAIEFNASKTSEIRYWQPNFERPADIDVAALRDAVLPTLSHAIKLMRPDAATGSFLSGGLDSSTVTGLLSEISEPSANAFSVGFGIDEFDEMEFADTASNHFGCRHFKYEVTAEDIVDAIPKIAATYDEPFGNSSAVPTYFCALLAKQSGVTHLLAGDGGDEVFGGNERYVRHKVFEFYSKIPSVLRHRLLEPLANLLDPETSLFPFRKFSSYVRQAMIQLPERFESWNLIYREGPQRVFSEEFLARVDPQAPLRHMADVWDSCPSDDLLDRMLWYDWRFTLADNDIRKVSTMSELAGVKVSYPMLQEDFVDLSIRVPSAEKISRHELRTFFRDAVRDYLPAKIIEKQKHGFGLPFGEWLKTHGALQELVYSSLDSLQARAVFNSGFIKRVMVEHQEGHAGYYGYAIWDLVMLEQWFQCHRGPA